MKCSEISITVLLKTAGSCAFDITYISPLEALKAIKNSGGLAVLHTVVSSRISALYRSLLKTVWTVWSLITILILPKDRETIREYAEKYSLFLTGGSDFHGEFEPADVDLGDFIAEQSGIEKIFD